jgi:hypothetical protein
MGTAMRCIGLSILVSTGCIDRFSGSNVQFDFSPTMPVQAPVGAAPKDGELPANVHFTFYAFEADDVAGRLYELERFEIHRIVDLQSPCFIDVGDRVPHPGLHVSQYAAVIQQDTGILELSNPPPSATEQQKIDAATAVQRQLNVTVMSSDAGIKVVSSASAATYPPVAASCTDPGIPPPTCTDADSNARRLAACQSAWSAAPDYYEGTDRVPTEPLAGTHLGVVAGINPLNLAPVGGAEMYVDEVLDRFTGYAIYWQYDDADGDGAPDYPSGFVPEQPDIGTLLLFGRPTMPSRGVIRVHMTNATSPFLTADVAIFADLAEDDVHF